MNKRLILSTIALAACTDAVLVRVGGGDAGAPDGGAGFDATTAAPDAATAGDAGPVGDAEPPLTITIFPRVGDPADDVTPPEGPGLVLMGGGPDVDSAFMWARDTVAPGRSGRVGDLVVLAAAGGDSYAASLYARLPIRSAQAIAIPSGASAYDLEAAGSVVERAEYVWYVGGQQSAYAAWNGSALTRAVQKVYDRGGVVGGTSAGALVLGAFVFDAIAAGISENVTPAVATADPFDPLISFTRHMFDFPPLADAITDVHFEERDRMGRLAMFMARQHTDGAIARTPPMVLGIGIDEDAALVIDKGAVARLLPRTEKGRVFLVKGGPPLVAEAGARLVYPGLEVHRLDDATQTFELGRWCGTAPVYTLDLAEDGGFGPAPYDRPGVSSPCP